MIEILILMGLKRSLSTVCILMQNGAGALTAAYLKNTYLEVAAAPEDHFFDL